MILARKYSRKSKGGSMTRSIPLRNQVSCVVAKNPVANVGIVVAPSIYARSWAGAGPVTDRKMT